MRTLETDRLIIRAFTLQDADTYARLLDAAFGADSYGPPEEKRVVASLKKWRLADSARTTRAVAEDDIGLDARHGAVDEDERNAEFGEPAQVRERTIAHRGDHRSLDPVRNQLFDHLALDAEVRSGVAEDHVVVGAACDLLGCSHDCREEGIRDVGDDHRERACPLPTQPAGEPARDVAEVRDRLFDSAAGLRADAVAVVDHPGNRHRRDP